MAKWSTGLLAALASLAGGVSVAAAPLPVTTLLADFNVITDQNVNVSNDIGGGVLAGANLGPGIGPLNFTNIVLGTTPGTVAISGYGEVDIFGNHTAPFNNSHGHVFVGGPSSGTFPGAASATFNYAFPPGATPAANPATFASDVWAPLTSFSGSLQGLTQNSSFNKTTRTFTFVPDPVTHIAVVDITAADLADHTGVLTFHGLPAAPAGLAIINVDGNFTDPGASYNAGAGQSNVLWNFFDATAVNLGTWGASALAPDALLTGLGGDITGDVVALNFTTTAETHVNRLDCPAAVCAPVNTPEPGSIAVLGTALASWAVLHRRRRG